MKIKYMYAYRRKNESKMRSFYKIRMYSYKVFVTRFLLAPVRQRLSDSVFERHWNRTLKACVASCHFRSFLAGMARPYDLLQKSAIGNMPRALRHLSENSLTPNLKKCFARLLLAFMQRCVATQIRHYLSTCTFVIYDLDLILDTALFIFKLLKFTEGEGINRK